MRYAALTASYAELHAIKSTIAAAPLVIHLAEFVSTDAGWYWQCKQEWLIKIDVFQ